MAGRLRMERLIPSQNLEARDAPCELNGRGRAEAALKKCERFDQNVVVRQQSLARSEKGLEEFSRSSCLGS